MPRSENLVFDHVEGVLAPDGLGQPGRTTPGRGCTQVQFGQTDRRALRSGKSKRAAKRELDTGEAFRLIDALSGAKVLYLSLTGGESLARGGELVKLR